MIDIHPYFQEHILATVSLISNLTSKNPFHLFQITLAATRAFMFLTLSLHLYFHFLSHSLLLFLFASFYCQ